MVKRLTLLWILAASALALWLGAGCGPSTELTGTPIPNIPPSTRVTATPPSLIETGFIVQFHWSGFDPDGRVVKYQWRISDNGTNGISIRDTLTLDPVTGDTLNPWHETSATDSVFVVTADIPDFPGDSTGEHYPRSFQTHTFWVRAVDDKGAVDPTPAHVSFTATTLIPTVKFNAPGPVAGQAGGSWADMPRAAVFGYTGVDPDSYSGLPTKFRYLWKRAEFNGQRIRTNQEYNSYNIDDLICFEDSSWSPWQSFVVNSDLRKISIPDLTTAADVYYFLALQVQDTAGAVSIGRGYGMQVANVRIASGVTPRLGVNERYLGNWTPLFGLLNFYSSDIAAGQELEFKWSANAHAYLGTIESYRYGWNVSDPNDVDDPNWAVQPGLSPLHMQTAPGTSFSQGIQTLTIQVVDNSNNVTRFNMTLSVVRVPDRVDQRDVLLIDDVNDHGSTAWVGPPGNSVPLNRDQYRDAFWLYALTGPGGVSLFSPEFDIIDISEPIYEFLSYREAVKYKVLLWTSSYSSTGSFVGDSFRPTFVTGTGDVDKYVWLIPYQREVGNVLVAGSQAMMSHLAVLSASYETPVVFESREGATRTGIAEVGNLSVRRGFGRRDVHGAVQWIGPTRYPFETMGVSVLDIMSHDGYYEYGTGRVLQARRSPRCVSMKGVAIDPAFKLKYMPDGAGFPDTIWLDPVIDWRDQSPYPAGNETDILQRPLPTIWDRDEFYNSVIVQRGTPYTVQAGTAWNCDGPCVEPMFRSISRFDWIRLRRLQDDPGDDWPHGYYSDTGGPAHGTPLREWCGQFGLEIDNRSAKTANRVTGFISQKNVSDKPFPVGDVVLGFDPYRFNNQHMTRVVQWLLGEHFGLDMTASDDTYRR